MSGTEFVAALAGTLASLIWIYAFVTGGFGNDERLESRDDSQRTGRP